MRLTHGGNKGLRKQLVKDLHGRGRRARRYSQRGAAGTTQKLACDSPSLRTENLSVTATCDSPSFRTENLSVTATWGKQTTQGGPAKPRQQLLASGATRLSNFLDGPQASVVQGSSCSLGESEATENKSPRLPWDYRHRGKWESF